MVLVLVKEAWAPGFIKFGWNPKIKSVKEAED